MSVAAVVLTGFVINWLSDEIRVSSPILIALAGLSLVLLVAVEKNANTPMRFQGVNVQFAKLGLVGLLLGSLAGAIAVAPVAQVRTVSGPWGVFHNYEVGTAAFLTLAAAISAVRRKNAAEWLIFLTGSIAGMTLSIVYLKPGNAFVPTFAGWLAASVLVTTVIANGRDLGAIFFNFLGFGNGPKKRARR